MKRTVSTGFIGKLSEILPNSELISHIFPYLKIEDKLVTNFNLRNLENLKNLLPILNSQRKKRAIILIPKR